MSQLALLQAVVAQLIGTPALGLDEAACQITHDGRPNPSSGEKFVAVSPGYWREFGSEGLTLHEEFGANVTVSLRLGSTPRDQIGPAVLAKAQVGLLALCERVRAAIHMDPADSGVNAVLWRANEIIGNQANGFYEPLQFQDGGTAQVQQGWWYDAADEKYAALTQTLRFGGARRVQNIEGQQ